MREPGSRFCEFNFSADSDLVVAFNAVKAAALLSHSMKGARLRRRPLQTLAEKLAGDFGDVLALVAGDFQLVFAGLA